MESVTRLKHEADTGMEFVCVYCERKFKLKSNCKRHEKLIKIFFISQPKWSGNVFFAFIISVIGVFRYHEADRARPMV